MSYRQEDAAEHVGAKVSKISRLELGQTRVTLAEVKMLLEFYGDDPAHIDVLLGLARKSNQRGRWDSYRAAFPQLFRLFVDLEAGAEEIRQVQVEIVPGLLQVEPYIRTTRVQSPRDPSAPAVEANVRARLERQRILARSDPPRTTFVLQESCLHRRLGGAEVMRADPGAAVRRQDT